MLDERQLLAVEKLVEGVLTRTDIAKVVGIHRTTLYKWLDDPEFVAEVDRRLQVIKGFAENKIKAHVGFALNNLIELAADSSNRRVQAQVNQYLMDRALGRPTTKVDVEAGLKETPTGVDVLQDEFNEFERDK